MYQVVCPHQNYIPLCLSLFPPLLFLSTIHLHFLDLTDSSPASFPPSGVAYICPGTKVSVSTSIIDPILSLYTPHVRFSLSNSLSLKSPSPCWMSIPSSSCLLHNPSQSPTCPLCSWKILTLWSPFLCFINPILSPGDFWHILSPLSSATRSWFCFSSCCHQ